MSEERHPAWGYCQVPSGSTVDMTEEIENQIERFAPGFKEVIIKRHITDSGHYETYNPNYMAGDIDAGAQDWLQLFARPVLRVNPYTSLNPVNFICSASAPREAGSTVGVDIMLPVPY
ncbi:MAG: hypothetical protein JSW33_02220 [bacterium]|nr:MAG: hypothetical protein JSW33_02220 [bacterium]